MVFNCSDFCIIWENAPRRIFAIKEIWVLISFEVHIQFFEFCVKPAILDEGFNFIEMKNPI